MKKVPKITKKQQAILDKYADIVEKGDIRKKIGDKEYNKIQANIYDINKEIRKNLVEAKKLNEEISKLQEQGKDARGAIDDVENKKQQLKENKQKKYELEYRKRTAGGWLTHKSKRYDIDTSGEADDEMTEAIIAGLIDRLENYRDGDYLRTTYYHTYGFDYVDYELVKMYAIMEGFI